MKRILSFVLGIVLLITIGCINSLAEETDSVSELKKYEIMTGDVDGNMRLSDNLTRAEAVTLLVRMYGFKPETSDAVQANVFPDMDGHWACNAAMIAKGLKLTDKTEGETFNPDESIASEEFLKMIVCLLGYQEVAEKKGGNVHGYLLQASQLGVTKSIAMATGQAITRGDAAQILCNSLDIPLMVMTSFSFKGANEYTILNGENGVEYRTVRTMLEK